MRTVSWHCDRCGVAIHVGRVTLQTMTGAERLRRPELDAAGARPRSGGGSIGPDRPAPDPTWGAMGSSAEPGRSQGETRRRPGARARPAS